ncbi:MAG: type II toxin-antitoxin system PemK/MazF family toxin [Myxococcales bacterium]|nr:type II toxin-antitoxin system PemK/MazF family toxin [Myxococcales bacterium]
MRRGEVWWAKLPLPAGRRPVVLVSRDSAYAVRASVTVAEISTTVRAIPSEVPLGKREGLPRRCVVNTDSVVTIPKTWLDTPIGPLPNDKLEAVDAALKFSLGLG